MAKEKKKTPALVETEEPAAAPKKSRKKRVIIVLFVLLLMLVGIGAGGYWWFFIRNPGVLPFTQSTEDPQAPQTAESQDGKPDAAAKTQGEASNNQGRLEKPAGLPRSNGVVLPLPMVTVNLYDNGGHRYLKLGMEVEANKDISQAIKANEPRIRDAVIMLLAGKSYSEIASPDGKVMLKAEVANRLNQILGEQRIIRVYFTDFVVQ